MKKKKVLLVIIIFLILILVAFAGVYAYITLDIFRTPKELFVKYFNNQVEQIENMNTGAIKTVSENLKSSPSETEYSMKAKMTYDNEEISLKYKQTITLDPENFAAMLNLNTTLESVNGETTIEDENIELPIEFMNYSLYGDKDKILLKIPELNEKYFSITTDGALEKSEELLNENEISNVELSKESIERYKVEFKNLYNKYLEEIKAKLVDDKFSVDKNVQVNVNNVALTANKYTFSISTTEFKTIIIDLLTKISEEPILSELLTEEQLSNFKESIPTITDDTEIFEEEATLKLCIYENGGNTVKMEIQSNEKILAELMTTKVSDTETRLVVSTIIPKTEEGEVGETQTITYSVNSEDENNTTTTVTTSKVYDEEDIKALKKYYEENEYYYYTDEMIEEQYKNTTTSETTKTTVNGNTATSQITIKDDNDSNTMEISNSKVEYNFGITPKFDDFENVIELDEYLNDETKMSQLFMECMQNLENNPNTFFGSIYQMIMSFSNFTNSFAELNSLSENDTEENTNDDTQTVSSAKLEIEELITDALNSCLESYQEDSLEDSSVNIADYLTINKISEMVLSSTVSNLEMIDGSTLKCQYNDEIYYIKLVLNGDTLKVDSATAYTESEYQDL